MYLKIEKYLQQIKPAEPNKGRKETLDSLVKYLDSKLKSGIRPQLNFICTHNSRRSQLSQVMAKTMASFYNIPLNTYSGGMEVTAAHENAIRTLEEIGFKTKKVGEENAVVRVSFADNELPIQLFSKEYQDERNPKANYAAVMTCSSADETCPFIPDADQRISLTYQDPKEFDGTEKEAEAYRACADLIASEMKYVMQQITVYEKA
tara:strand:- start:530 stop:1147 length:618 start_codon:yes stop_codon:yes gene_type:complete